MIRDNDTLDYHSMGRPGKLEVIPSKPCLTQRDLSMAYTPGVAVPCLRIRDDPNDAFKYTGKGNLVAVISNGTAVLGLGDIGALAGKPVMEGKGVLFKRFADVDVFDIELDTHDADEIIKCVKLLEPTFGGINLEDIKAPECFHIEETLKKEMTIPVFHDDQHGTAIISGAALMNAIELVGKDFKKIRVVFSGAGAAGIACANMYIALGVDPKNILMVDSKGVLHDGREKMNPYKEKYRRKTSARTLADALKDADVFVGVSAKGLVTPDMVRSMAKDPIIFAMANPDPEITYPDAKAARTDVIMATGRSDYPNQVNNVLGFPFIFRGALDVRARAINDQMKVAAAHALAKLAKEDVPDVVIKAYGGERFSFGREYIIPKPFDPRVLTWEAPAVARAAVETGVATAPIKDWDEYVAVLERRILGRGREVMRVVRQKARSKSKRIVFPEGGEEKVLRACQQIIDDKIAEPVLLGDAEEIRAHVAELGLDFAGVEIVDHRHSAKAEFYAKGLFDLRQRAGVTPFEADRLLKDPHYFGVMMVQTGDADGLVCGLNRSYPDTIRPALQIIQLKEGVTRVAGMYCMVLKDKVLFFADATVNIDPSAEELAEIAVMAALIAKEDFSIEPRVAMLSFSNFGSVKHPYAEKMRRATAIAKRLAPDLVLDGEMAADTALVPEICRTTFPHSRIAGDANVLIFPGLTSGNVAYKLVQHLAGAEVIGPILMGLKRPVNVLNHYSSVSEIVNITAITAVMARRANQSVVSAPGRAEKVGR
jgi:malate dehydrogenase (oxaloacetate-decarboxylating)(NADP+)